MSIVTRELVHTILEQYSLPPFGAHGPTHWARVLENGLRIAQQTGARADVVQLFAVFHDCRRESEGTDPGHGRRGADLAKEKRGEWFELDDHGMFALWEACAYHTDGRTEHSDVTIATCWDADRLDLARVGILPDPQRLCTEVGRDPALMGWAVPRGRKREIPSLVTNDWGLAVPA